MSRVTRFTFMVRTETTGWGRFFCERKSVDWQKWENIWSDSTCFITLLCKPQISPRLTHYFTFTFLYLLATIHSRRYKGWFWRYYSHQGSQQPTAVWVTPLDTFKNTWDRTGCFLRRPGDVSSCFSCNQIFFFFPWSRTVSIRVRGNRNRFLATLKSKCWEPPTPTVRVAFEELNCPLKSCCCCNNNLNIL